MKTTDLIAALAAEAPAVRMAPVTRLVGLGVVVGAALALALLVAWLGMRDLDQAIHTTAYWMKTLYTLAFASSGLWLVRRLARPGGAPGGAAVLAAGAFAVMVVLAGVELAQAGPEQWRALWMGHTMPLCSLRILALSTPVYLGIAVALRRLAPTRLAMTGAAAGLLAGGAGATVYGLYCDESAVTFVTAWYTVGMGLSAGLGALIGSRLLRW